MADSSSHHESPMQPPARWAAPIAVPANAQRGTRWGPDNPHPLSTMKTELVWEGKYDEWGNRRQVDAASLAMPMQRIETIDHPRSAAAAEGEQSLIQFEKTTSRVDDFRNRLIWGDNKLVMASLLQEFKGKVDLIYIDPPFDVGADFTMAIPVGDKRDEIWKDQSALETIAYRDMWGKGSNSYLQTMIDRLALMRDLLAETGSIFVHCDWRVSSYIRLALDEIFGRDRFSNEIVWAYSTQGRPENRFARKHDIIYWFTATDNHTFNVDDARVPYSEAYIKSHFKDIDEGGRVCRIRTDAGKTRVYYPDKGMIPNDVWADIYYENPVSSIRTGYATQKPESLLERILKSSSNKGDVVADFFCGSGTTGAVAEKLGRRWIMADLGRFAIHTARKRLIGVQRELHNQGQPYRAFDVYNLGRYERQWWQQEALKGADEEHRRVVLEFFRAEVLDPAKSSSPLIHGRKGRALCHVDGIDSIFEASEARAVARAAAAMGAKEVYCLAWDFEMDIRQRIAAIEAEMGVKLHPVKIPREVMEKNRKPGVGAVPWLEVAALEAEPVMRKTAGKGAPTPVDIKLTRFLPSLAEVPPKELESIKERAVKSGFDFIDFWAVDFDWKPERPFNHHWQDYRTRKDRSLKTVSDAGHVYPKKDSYTACVKVVDVFGSDTSITVPVRV